MSAALPAGTMRRPTLGIFVLALLLLAPVATAVAGVTASFRYALSNFEGPVRSQWARLAVDHERNEIYALHQRQNDIRIFDEHGMEIFVFGDGFATAADISIGDHGDIFILATGYQTSALHRLDYRGQHVAEIPLQKVPDEFSKFVADRIEYRRGSLYLVDSDALLLLVVDEDGVFERGYDLTTPLKSFLPDEKYVRELAAADWKRKKLEDIDINGFTVDDDGNVFFTVPVLFSAFRFSPDGELAVFGRAGSGKGKFGVSAGIATDDMGFVYVADRLRCVVLVFDRDLRFQTEFGYRGDQPSNLIVPDDLVIDDNGNVYVGQAANRGVSVFEVVRDETSPLESRQGEVRPVRSRAAARTSSRGPRASESRRTVEEERSAPEAFGVDRGGDVTESEDDSGWTIEEFDSQHE
jgi:sugar lactone lactonase YvrE